MLRKCYRENELGNPIKVMCETVGDREIYLDGIIVDYKNLDTYTQNEIDEVIDIFEDEGNRIENGYEIYEQGRLLIKRKVIPVDEILQTN